MTFTCSVEVFYPSADQARVDWWKGIEKLAACEPSFLSLTCKSKLPLDGIADLVAQIKRRTGLKVVAHITAWNRHPNQVRNLVIDLTQAGASGVLALHGDIPDQATTRSTDVIPSTGHLLEIVRDYAPSLQRYAAVLPDRNPFDPRPLSTALSEKVKSGAQGFITQASYDLESVKYVIQRVQALERDCILGLYIPEDYARFERFGKFCLVPSVATAIERINSAPSESLGIDKLVQDVLDQATASAVSDLHVFTMNRFDHIIPWLKRLRLSPSLHKPRQRGFFVSLEILK